MINLKNLFHANPFLLTVSKPEKELLEYFVANKQAFEHWLSHCPQQRVRFQFYFPTAVDFFFDEFHLFTAYFKRTPTDGMELSELKMTKANYNTIRSANWKPFEELILQFLRALEETNKTQFFQKTKSLHEYAAICQETTNDTQNVAAHILNPSIAPG